MKPAIQPQRSRSDEIWEIDEDRIPANKIVGRISHLQDKSAFQQLLDRLYKKKWVTYCKRPFGGPEEVIRYLGHYTHRVAISNNRIKSYTNGEVTFRWKDYRNQHQTKLMTLKVDEFIRRFLLHILPHNFYRIRYYGLLANRNRKVKLERCRELLRVVVDFESRNISSKRFDILLLELCGVDIWQCPACESGRRVRVALLPRVKGHPP